MIEQVTVAKIPDCDVCKHDGVERPAYADAKPGTGYGQKLVVQR